MARAMGEGNQRREVRRGHARIHRAAKAISTARALTPSTGKKRTGEVPPGERTAKSTAASSNPRVSAVASAVVSASRLWSARSAMGDVMGLRPQR